MSEAAYDYSRDVVQNTGDNILARLAAKADEAMAAKRAVEAAEASLKAAQELHRDIIQRQLPELMDEAGQKDCVTSNGFRLTVAEVIRASIPAANAPVAFAWLEEHGHSSVIKNEVKVQFGRGEDKAATDALAALSGLGLHPDQKRTVHPQTLQSLIKELMADGVDVPLDTFGAHIQREVKIK